MHSGDIDALIAARKADMTRLRGEIRTLQKAKRLVIKAEREQAPGRLRYRRPPVTDFLELEPEIMTALVAGRVRRRPYLGHMMRDVLVADSDAWRARQEILDARKPLHVDAILDKIKERTGARPKRTSLVGSLARYAKDGRHFFRAGPNTFGLIEMKKKK